MTQSDDQSLLNRLRLGNREACAELVRRHYERVYRFLFHLTRDVHRAEDLTQETFSAAWQRLASFEGRATFSTWLHRIAYTRFVDAQRAERRDLGMREKRRFSPQTPADPLFAAMAEDEVQNLYLALDELKAAERSLLVLHYLQGLSYREMAAVVDEPVGTVKWRTAEALHRLRALLKEEVPDHALRRTAEPGPIS